MSDSSKDVTFSLKVMVNKEKTKVLFAEAGSDFSDVLLSFLTLPLGRIVKILEKHYGDEAPVFGSITSLYKGLVNLDNVHFWTEAAKLVLLNPVSSSEAEYKTLKLDISDSQPTEYFCCESCSYKFDSLSMFYDTAKCGYCYELMSTERKIAKKESEDNEVFAMNTASFVISDDLQIVSNVKGILHTVGVLGVKDIYGAELMNVTLGFSEIMDLLKASLISPTPLSCLILNKARHINSATVNSEPVTYNKEVATTEPKKMILQVIVQKSTKKVLFVHAEKDFVEFLFSFLIIPLGGVECLLENKTSITSIDNLYRSIEDHIDDRCFKTTDTKNRLIKPKLMHGYISQNHILPLIQESLPGSYSPAWIGSSVKFPKGQGSYLKGPGLYKVTDDLTVTPCCVASVLSTLNEMKVPLSDVEEQELHIGLDEGLSILKASLTSTSVLTNALMNHILLKKQQK